MRTLEETSRFILNDSATTAVLKSLRHELADVERSLPRDARLTARDTAGDVGTRIAVDSENSRSHHREVVVAASARVQQSLRVAEEHLKRFDGRSAGAVEGIRYRFYDTSAQLELALTRIDRRVRLAGASIYVLVTASRSADQFCQNVRSLLKSGADVLQLRDRSVSDRELFERCRIAQSVANELGKLFIVNDRADIAAAADADGVHVGQDELPPAAVRRVVGPDKLVGLSTHDLTQVTDSSTQPIDYIGCGPVFPSQTKAFDRYTGTGWLTEAAQQTKVPAFAIGGIDIANAAQVANAGIRRIAVSGALDPERYDPGDLADRIRQLKSRIQAG